MKILDSYSVDAMVALQLDFSFGRDVDMELFDTHKSFDFRLSSKDVVVVVLDQSDGDDALEFGVVTRVVS